MSESYDFKMDILVKQREQRNYILTNLTTYTFRLIMLIFTNYEHVD